MHILVGAVLGWLLFKTYSGIPIPIQIFYTSFIIGVIGTMWEWGWQMYNGSEIDEWDVVRAVAAGLAVNIFLLIV